jgi:hypothetical protein
MIFLVGFVLISHTPPVEEGEREEVTVWARIHQKNFILFLFL